jgi:N-acyl-D-amino-acid deacylase
MKALIVVFLYGPLAWGADSPSPERIRSAAEKALALLQASQEIWDAKQLGGQGCASCHHQLMPQLAYRVACEHGLRVNERVARENARRALSSRAELDRAVQYTHVIGPSVADALRLVAEDAAGGRRNIARAVYARLIAARQNPSGAWDRDSFHQRPPSSYSPFTQTALAVRALQLYSHPSLQADTEARLARARQWLLSQAPHQTEERTFQLFGLWWAGADRATLDKLARGLLGTQQPGESAFA